AENPVAGRRVELEVSGTGNTVSAATTSTLDGEATFTISSTLAEAKMVRALVGLGASQVTLPAQHTVTFVPGPPGAPSTFEWLMEPAAADGVAQVRARVTAKDTKGNLI